MRICPRCQAPYPDSERFCAKDSATLVEKSDFVRIGTTVGNYKLTSVMGRGGMGTVYKGEHVYIGKLVAVKILHERFARYEDAVKRFLREARAASSIQHPNIVDVNDFGPTQDGGVYFVMEFLEGESLEDLIEREAPIRLHRTINIVNQMASALAAAHEKKIVHRDLKPENVMLTKRTGRREVVRRDQDAVHVEPEAEFDFVKVLDFGIAKVLDPEAAGLSSSGTVAGTIFGTPEYMSPEGARGQLVDARADIYSLGVIMYDMLTGRVPFYADTPVEVLTKHISEAPVPPREVVPNHEITEAAERLILKALEKDPARRQQNMEEFRHELQGCYGSVAYRRDVEMVPTLRQAGVKPRARRLTEELDEWLAAHRTELDAARERLEEIARAPESVPAGVDRWDEVTGMGKGTEAPPMLLTQRKPKK